MKLARLGLIVNPTAGPGGGHGERVARVALLALRPERVLTAPGALGGDAIDDPGAWEPLPTAGEGRAATRALAVSAARAGVDALLVVGGDGTLADVADALHAEGLRCPILGVGAGSTNAGALVSVRAADAATLAPARLRVRRVAALEASVPGRAALAFNDVVLGTTIVGTHEGDLVDLEAAAFLHGRLVRARPTPLRCATARVRRCADPDARPGGARASARDVLLAAGESIGALVVGFTDRIDGIAQALVGGPALSRWVGVPAGCLVSGFPLVSAGFDRADHDAMEPLHTAYAGLSVGDVLEITGVDGASLIADGHPLRELVAGDVARVRVLPGAVDVVRPPEGPA